MLRNDSPEPSSAIDRYCLFFLSHFLSPHSRSIIPKGANNALCASRRLACSRGTYRRTRQIRRKCHTVTIPEHPDFRVVMLKVLCSCRLFVLLWFPKLHHATKTFRSAVPRSSVIAFAVKCHLHGELASLPVRTADQSAQADKTRSTAAKRSRRH